MNEFELLRKQIRTEMNDLADAMAVGAAEDYPAYRHMVGKIEGLATAERIVLDLEERLLKADE
jgi:hypothetical protein